MDNISKYINPLETDRKALWEEILDKFRKPRRRKEHQAFIKAFDSGIDIIVNEGMAKSLDSSLKIGKFLYWGVLGKGVCSDDKADELRQVKFTAEGGSLFFDYI